MDKVNATPRKCELENFIWDNGFREYLESKNFVFSHLHMKYGQVCSRDTGVACVNVCISCINSDAEIVFKVENWRCGNKVYERDIFVPFAVFLNAKEVPAGFVTAIAHELLWLEQQNYEPFSIHDDRIKRCCVCAAAQIVEINSEEYRQTFFDINNPDRIAAIHYNPKTGEIFTGAWENGKQIILRTVNKATVDDYYKYFSLYQHFVLFSSSWEISCEVSSKLEKLEKN